ncbi:hypothetical protein GH714_023751 [Hevea brasiliensis]|uniref:Uncharacterized protein n=1 Tax=Hevea brasiliensis TaxID=3981 RepID=A0A6A6LIW7_HEVBR|nr:hypothetical protein GH714_023751 [Hevea brasiliensis]
MEGFFTSEGLSSLKNLESLDVSFNRFNSTIPIQDSKNFSKFSKLKYLDLSWNKFNTDILSFSSIFSSVETLNLYSNELRGPLLFRDIVKLQNLTTFNIGGNNLNGTQPIQSLCQLTRLQELNLGDNNFGGNLPPCLKNLTSLRFLDMSGNQFTGHIPSWKGLKDQFNRHYIGRSGYYRVEIDENEEVDFVIKHIDYTYKSHILDNLFGLDLSDNNLEGKIPDTLQFGTFDSSSYEGNRFLCGPLLEKNCDSDNESPQSPTRMEHEANVKWYEIDEVLLILSLVGCFRLWERSKGRRLKDLDWHFKGVVGSYG